jgi:hypothetical protein
MEEHSRWDNVIGYGTRLRYRQFIESVSSLGHEECLWCYGAEHPRGSFLRTRDNTPVVRNMHGSFLVHSASFTFNRTLLPTEARHRYYYDTK